MCVTHRKLCAEDFLTRIARIAAARPKRIILREKDLPAAEYAALAQKVSAICAAHAVPLTLSGHAVLAERMGLSVQLSFAAAQEGLPAAPAGVSIHSAEEAAQLCGRGAAWLLAGHIWETGCKPGVPARGTDFLHTVVRAADAPVYAIGGITPAHMSEVYAAGAAGACVISMLMTCADPAAYLAAFDGAGKAARK